MKKIAILFCLFLGFNAGTTYAAKRYVDDNLTITVRSGPGKANKVLKAITTGTSMEVLEENSDSGYALVRLEDGMEGWVRIQYLTDKPVAKDRLAWLQGKYDKLKDTAKQQKEELATLKAEYAKLSRDSKSMEKESKTLQDKMAHINQVAAKPILLDKENRELKEKNVTLTNEMQLISQENQILKDRADRDWFIAGGGVMLLGIILGLILPKLGWRKKSSWGSGGL